MDESKFANSKNILAGTYVNPEENIFKRNTRRDNRTIRMNTVAENKRKSYFSENIVKRNADNLKSMTLKLPSFNYKKQTKQIPSSDTEFFASYNEYFMRLFTDYHYKIPAPTYFPKANTPKPKDTVKHLNSRENIEMEELDTKNSFIILKAKGFKDQGDAGKANELIQSYKLNQKIKDYTKLIYYNILLKFVNFSMKGSVLASAMNSDLISLYEHYSAMKLNNNKDYYIEPSKLSEESLEAFYKNIRKLSYKFLIKDINGKEMRPGYNYNTTRKVFNRLNNSINKHFIIHNEEDESTDYSSTANQAQISSTPLGHKKSIRTNNRARSKFRINSLRFQSTSNLKRMSSATSFTRNSRSRKVTFKGSISNQLKIVYTFQESNLTVKPNTKYAKLTKILRLISLLKKKNFYISDSLSKIASIGQLTSLNKNKLTGIRKIVSYIIASRHQEITARNTHGEEADFFTFHPESNFIIWWNIIVSCCVVYNLIFLPVYFLNHRFMLSKIFLSNFQILDLFIDKVFFFDIVIKFRTGYVDSYNNLVMDIKKIISNYSNRGLIIDMITSFPFDVFTLDLDNGLLTFFKLPRALQLYRGLKLLENHRNRKMIDLFNLITIFYLFAHWLGCFIYYLLLEGLINVVVSDEESMECYYNDKLGVKDLNLVCKYGVSMYYGFSSIITQDIFSNLMTTEMKVVIVFIVVFILGQYFFSMIFSLISEHIEHSWNETNRLDLELEVCNNEMKFYDVDKQFIRIVNTYFNKLPNSNSRNLNLLENVILSKNIKDKLLACHHRNIIYKLPFLNGFRVDDLVIASFVNKITHRIYLPQEIVVKEGEVCDGMIAVNKGIFIITLLSEIFTQAEKTQFTFIYPKNIETQKIQEQFISQHQNAKSTKQAYPELKLYKSHDINCALEVKDIIKNQGIKRNKTHLNEKTNRENQYQVILEENSKVYEEEPLSNQPLQSGSKELADNDIDSIAESKYMKNLHYNTEIIARKDKLVHIESQHYNIKATQSKAEKKPTLKENLNKTMQNKRKTVSFDVHKNFGATQPDIRLDYAGNPSAEDDPVIIQLNEENDKTINLNNYLNTNKGEENEYDYKPYLDIIALFLKTERSWCSIISSSVSEVGFVSYELLKEFFGHNLNIYQELCDEAREQERKLGLFNNIKILNNVSLPSSRTCKLDYVEGPFTESAVWVNSEDLKSEPNFNEISILRINVPELDEKVNPFKNLS